ncbi:hypothetical protein R6Q57_008983 [Mikania cordata]
MSSSFPVLSSSSSSSDSEDIDLFISSLSTMAPENASQIPRPIIRRIQINRDREALLMMWNSEKGLSVG